MAWGLAAAAIAAAALMVAAKPARAEERHIAGKSFRLEIRVQDEMVHARLVAPEMGLVAADGPMVYEATDSDSGSALTFRNPVITGGSNRITVKGRLGPLDIEHRFRLLDYGDLEERVILRNQSSTMVRLRDFTIALSRRAKPVDPGQGWDLTGDRFIAIPLRHRATDPAGHMNDYSVDDLIAGKGWEPDINGGVLAYRQIPSARHLSEAWAWTHGDHTLGIFRFCQEHMQYSTLSTKEERAGYSLRFGGAGMFSGEPAALARMAPGDKVDLGVTRYHVVKGGYEECAYAYRDFLDANKCRFPANYDAPVHWEQLYDMEGAWDDRPNRYTLAALEREAQKGEGYSCEALYLDPGWDSAFATFLWGSWLGSEKEFVKHLREKYHLALSLHCPLATWMSVPFIMGPSGVDTWPQAARRKPPTEDMSALAVPAVHDGRRNLALRPEARVNASSVFDNGGNPLHQTPHLNDGWYGNANSWIAGQLPAWAEVDLGGVFRIGEVRLGNDHAGQYSDRVTTWLRILTATEHAAYSASPQWTVAYENRACSLHGTTGFTIKPVDARWVRIELLASSEGLPRLDEIEVYEADPTPESADFPKIARRGPAPKEPDRPLICQGSRAYLDEAVRRLIANCEAGAAFLMFDGTWWNGGCDDPTHGHPVPYRWEDHIRANLKLAQMVHARYPHVVIEMHDMLAGGSPVRITPVYYKYGLPGSYDDNWGFELMWNPMADIVEGRAASLYYYNLGCNVPVYLHIDLRSDNIHCLVLWWYASTCRHLGIGGTNKDAAVVKAEQAAMKVYKRLERFYKRGDFYGMGEEGHVHVLPAERACVVNLFNLSGEERVVEGSVYLSARGLDPHATYRSTESWASSESGTVHARLRMAPWSAAVAELTPDPGK